MDMKSVWHGIEGIVLDAVGTLITPQPTVASAYTAAAAHQGVTLEERDVRSRFHQHFRDDESRGDCNTDEALELQRWRRIVGAVLPEIPDQERAFRELWDHFSRAEAWRCFEDVAPA